MRFVLDGSYRRSRPDVILGGSPLRLFRLTAAGQAVADALEQGTTLPADHAALTDRLIDAGAIHPVPTGRDRKRRDGRRPGLRTDAPRRRRGGRVVVVDDASARSDRGPRRDGDPPAAEPRPGGGAQRRARHRHHAVRRLRRRRRRAARPTGSTRCSATSPTSASPSSRRGCAPRRAVRSWSTRSRREHGSLDLGAAARACRRRQPRVRTCPPRRSSAALRRIRGGRRVRRGAAVRARTSTSSGGWSRPAGGAATSRRWWSSTEARPIAGRLAAPAVRLRHERRAAGAAPSRCAGPTAGQRVERGHVGPRRRPAARSPPRC